MKWRLPEEPNLGDRRSITRFAWWPMEMSNGYAVWLEKYVEYQEYSEITVFDGCEVYPGVDWVRTSREAILKSGEIE